MLVKRERVSYPEMQVWKTRFRAYLDDYLASRKTHNSFKHRAHRVWVESFEDVDVNQLFDYEMDEKLEELNTVSRSPIPSNVQDAEIALETHIPEIDEDWSELIQPTPSQRTRTKEQGAKKTSKKRKREEVSSHAISSTLIRQLLTQPPCASDPWNERQLICIPETIRSKRVKTESDPPPRDGSDVKHRKMLSELRTRYITWRKTHTPSTPAPRLAVSTDPDVDERGKENRRFRYAYNCELIQWFEKQLGR